MLKISFAQQTLPTQGALVLTVAEEGKLGPLAQKLDQKTDGALKRAIKAAEFTGKAERILSIYAPAKTHLTRIILVGIGKSAAVTDVSLQKVGAAVYAVLGAGKESQATLWFDTAKALPIDCDQALVNIAFGFKLRSYRFDKYRTTQKPEAKPVIKALVLAGGAGAKSAWACLDKVAEGVFLTRNLVTEPSNILYPETLAAEAKGLEALGLVVDVLDEKRMAKLGMGALLGVAQGSVRPPRLVTLVWKGNPGAKDQCPIAFVGKGVTFDTGGISLKPGAGMWDMKYDMAGSAAVLGAMKVLASRKAKANVVGVIGLVENMPDGGAQRPGDVVTSMSGQTIEVLNTDAEGRLVLADAVWYAQEKFNPSVVVDLATLTGAIRIALGSEYAGLFTNNDTLRDQLLAAGKDVDEALWAMPMHDAYDKALDSPIADIKNISDGSVGAGSATAAHFINRFIKKGVAWAHLDIASVAWAAKDKGVVPKGASAFGVRLIDRLVALSAE